MLLREFADHGKSSAVVVSEAWLESDRWEVGPIASKGCAQKSLTWQGGTKFLGDAGQTPFQTATRVASPCTFSPIFT